MGDQHVDILKEYPVQLKKQANKITCRLHLQLTDNEWTDKTPSLIVHLGSLVMKETMQNG